ncbi:HOMEODOMAIN PROTEIN 8 putative-RELATED [Salix purpurea]|uniref:HOMEODOMAIN PROTEIN 8 putative-RELATED n=1 Tax=Salix purpurea TaxID=77065 RepID=A0A9Q0Q231_SALPP|nr:HOMEODOMAIN PROTEIN 8 putative-RELATED [Salix purpurea]
MPPLLLFSSIYIIIPQAPPLSKLPLLDPLAENIQKKNKTPEYKLLLCCTFTRGWCEDDMATGAADGFFRYVHDGCLSGGEVGFDRRPYHRNCRCALHNSKENCSHTMSRYKNVSYPIKRRWSEGNLALMVANSSSSSSNSPPSSLQAGRSATTPHQRRSSHDLDVEDHVYSLKV